MKAIEYKQFGQPEVLKMVEKEETLPKKDEVRVLVKSVGLNPVDYKIFEGTKQLKMLSFIQGLRHPWRWFAGRSSLFPCGVARDFAGVVDAVGQNVDTFKIGDPVLGMIYSAPGLGDKKGTLAEKICLDTSHVVKKPQNLGFEEAAAISVAAETVCGAFRHLEVDSKDFIVISAAAGGIGSLATQLAIERGLTVIGIASEKNHDYLRSLGAIPISYAGDIKTKILQATSSPVTKFLDCFGGIYVSLAFSLGLDGKDIGTLVPSPLSLIRGAQFTGPRYGKASDIAEIAGLVADGKIAITIEKSFGFSQSQVQEAYSDLSKGHTRGKIIVKISE